MKLEYSNEVHNKIQNFCHELQNHINDYFVKHGYKFEPDFIGCEVGKRYVKVVKITYGGEGQKSVVCFIEKATGNILKAASWNAPAKGVRGNVANGFESVKTRCDIIGHYGLIGL